MSEIRYQSFYSLEDCEEIIKVLNAHQIPYRIYKEAQTGFKVYTGENLVKEVHLFIEAADAQEVDRIISEEMPEYNHPPSDVEEVHDYYSFEEDEELIPKEGFKVPSWMLVLGYFSSILGMLLGLFFALKIYYARTEGGQYYYNLSGRRHAVNMLIIAVVEFVFGAIYLFSKI